MAYIGNKGGIKSFSDKLLDRLEKKGLQAIASTVGKLGLVQVRECMHGGTDVSSSCMEP